MSNVDLDGIDDDDGPVNPDSATIAANGAVGTTDLGRIRQRNEDAMVIDDRFVVVCDGMGGHGSGDRASRAAADAASEYLAGGSIDALALREAVVVADEAVRRVRTEAGRRTPGSTIVIVARHRDGERVVGAWDGDSRAYLWSPEMPDDEGEAFGATDQLRQLTTDHADASGLLTSHLGGYDSYGRRPTGETFEVTPTPGQRILVCTDGLHGYVQRSTIDQVLSTNVDSTIAAKKLRDAALAAGGEDNVTIAIFDC